VRYALNNVGCSTKRPTRRETLFHPSGAGLFFLAEAPIQMIRAPAQLVSRRSILPTGNLATLLLIDRALLRRDSAQPMLKDPKKLLHTRPLPISAWVNH
jgi:hypothetical protein